MPSSFFLWATWILSCLFISQGSFSLSPKRRKLELRKICMYQPKMSKRKKFRKMVLCSIKILPLKAYQLEMQACIMHLITSFQLEICYHRRNEGAKSYLNYHKIYQMRERSFWWRQKRLHGCSEKVLLVANLFPNVY